MLKKRIIPCLDVQNGRVVKGVKFIGLKDAGDPVEIAKRYDAEGADELCFLDITASAEKRKIILDIVERTANEVFMPFTVGGGVGSVQDVCDLLHAGADKVSFNTAAVQHPEVVREAAEIFGSQCIVVAIDAKKVVRHDRRGGPPWPPAITDHYQVYTHGGRQQTTLNALDWARRVQELGAGEILLTSMDRDGTKQGYDLELTRLVVDKVHIPVIASGGAGTLAHLYDAFAKANASAALVASLFHHQEHTILAAKKYLSQRGIPVRVLPGE